MLSNNCYLMIAFFPDRIKNKEKHTKKKKTNKPKKQKNKQNNAQLSDGSFGEEKKLLFPENSCLKIVFFSSIELQKTTTKNKKQKQNAHYTYRLAKKGEIMIILLYCYICRHPSTLFQLTFLNDHFFPLSLSLCIYIYIYIYIYI